jgi:hypothetical protein
MPKYNLTKKEKELDDKLTDFYQMGCYRTAKFDADINDPYLQQCVEYFIAGYEDAFDADQW